MSSSMDATLRRAATSTFEELGFLFTEPEPTDAQDTVPMEMRSRVSFTGPMRGSLLVEMSAAEVRTMAENMMGGVPVVDPAIGRDALGELANVVCGNLLPSLAGARAVFDLEAPTAPSDGATSESAAHTAIATGTRAAACVVLGVEGGRARLSLFLDGGARRESIG